MGPFLMGLSLAQYSMAFVVSLCKTISATIGTGYLHKLGVFLKALLRASRESLLCLPVETPWLRSGNYRTNLTNKAQISSVRLTEADVHDSRPREPTSAVDDDVH